MNKAGSEPEDRSGEEEPRPGINLALVYGLIVLGLLAAMAFALMIVLPFYHRR